MTAIETPSVTACRSCGVELQGNWCHACGQGHRHVRLSLRGLSGDFLDELLAMDTRLMRTARALSREPGRVCRDFLGGRRVPWMNPIKYALFTATVAFLVQRWLFALMDAPVTEIEARTREFQNDFGMLTNFLFLPVWAGWMRLAFFRSGLRWVEHLVVAAYGFGHLFLMQTCLMPLMRLPGPGETIAGIIAVLLPVPYLTWLAVATWGSRWWVAGLLITVGWIGTQAVLGTVISLLFLT